MDKINELKKLKALLDDKVISQNEFDKLKGDILGNKTLGTNQENIGIEKKKMSEKIKKGNLNVSFSGEGGFFDSKTELYINGKLHSTQSTKKGFSVDIPIDGVEMELTVIWRAIFKFKSVYSLNKLVRNKSYRMKLFFDNQRGYLDNYNFLEDRG